MINLLAMWRFIGARSPESQCLQQAMQISQTRDVDARRAERHQRAYGRIKHPGGNDDRDSWLGFDNDNFPSRPPFRVKLPDLAAIQRVPAIMDLNLDMGRMNASSLSEDGTTSSRAVTRAAGAQQPYTPSWLARSSTDSTPKATSRTS